MARSRAGRTRAGFSALVTLVAAATVSVVLASPASADSIDNPGGPLTRVEITPDLNCAVSYLGDSEPEFFGDTACATLVAVGGTLYGPASIPAGGGASPRTPHTPVSQTQGGAGTTGSPFFITTVVDAGSSGLQIRQTDSYVAGQETYRTDIAVANNGRTPASAVVYKAADCYLQDSDEGFGAFDPASGAVSCVTSLDPGARIEQFYPLTGGSRYVESEYDDVWGLVGTQQPFPNECRECSNNVDNGMGLSWSVQIAVGATVTLSHLTNFSPLGNVPLNMSKIAQSSRTPVGGTNAYSIVINNPNADAVSIAEVTDELPAGFTYLPGSTTGATTADPTVAGSTLTWAGPFAVPGGSSLNLGFGVNVGPATGTFFNQASATADGIFTVAPTGPTAPITVGSGPGYGGCNVTVSDTTPSPGQSITVDGTGAEGGASVTAKIGPTTVGSGTADASGQFSFAAMVPASVRGTVIMTVSCGPDAVASVNLTVASPVQPTALPRTGAAHTLVLTALGLIVLNYGSLALTAGRKRRNALL